MAEQRGRSHILIPLPGEQRGPAALLLRGGDLGLEPLPREVILGPGPLSGGGPGLHRGGEGQGVHSGVAALGLLSDQAGPGAEIPREEAGQGQQGEAGPTLDPQPLEADPVLEHPPGGAGPAPEHPPGAGLDLEHLPGAGLDPEHPPGGAGLALERLPGADLEPDLQCGGGLAVDRRQGEAPDHAREPQPGVLAHAREPQLDVVGVHDPEPQLDVVGAHDPEPQPGEDGLDLEHQQGEAGPTVEVWLDGEIPLQNTAKKRQVWLILREEEQIQNISEEQVQLKHRNEEVSHFLTAEQICFFTPIQSKISLVCEAKPFRVLSVS